MGAPASRACWPPVMSISSSRWTATAATVSTICRCLLPPLLAGEADLVIGSRTLGSYEPGSLLPQQRFGNWLAALLLRLLYGVRVTDIGPFRVDPPRDLLALGMREMTYGWSVEMIARAARNGLRVREVPVTYRRERAGNRRSAGTCGLDTSGRADHRHDLALPP